MEQGWRPIAELRTGCYAIGLSADGHELDIYKTGAVVLNVATGEKLSDIVSWQVARIHDKAAPGGAKEPQLSAN
jgi:hypothetical protein